MLYAIEAFVIFIVGLVIGFFICKKKYNNRLEENQRKFLADASHELRTPVTIIRGYADMLENFGAEDTELLNEATVEIKKSAQNMQTLIENLLFLARADQNNLQLKKKSVNVNELLKKIVESYQNQRIEFVAGENFNLFGDAYYLEKMFREIIDNALKYSSEKVFVKIEGGKIKIIDSGIGISQTDCEKIFNRFYRSDKSRTNPDAEKISTGLGLSIAKWIADNHDIKIEVESKLGKGTCFDLKNG